VFVKDSNDILLSVINPRPRPEFSSYGLSLMFNILLKRIACLKVHYITSIKIIFLIYIIISGQMTILNILRGLSSQDSASSLSRTSCIDQSMNDMPGLFAKVTNCGKDAWKDTPFTDLYDLCKFAAWEKGCAYVSSDSWLYWVDGEKFYNVCSGTCSERNYAIADNSVCVDPYEGYRCYDDVVTKIYCNPDGEYGKHLFKPNSDVSPAKFLADDDGFIDFLKNNIADFPVDGKIYQSIKSHIHMWNKFVDKNKVYTFFLTDKEDEPFGPGLFTLNIDITNGGSDNWDETPSPNELTCDSLKTCQTVITCTTS